MTQLTKEGLIRALMDKTNGTILLAATPYFVAERITDNHLAQVLTGLRHDNRPVSFGRAFEIVWGERLTLERK